MYKTMLTADGCRLLQGRGLLQMKDNYIDGKLSSVTWRRVEELHLELMFVKIENPKQSILDKYKWFGEYQEQRIFFHQIESVFFRRGLILSKLVFKLRPKQIVILPNSEPEERVTLLNVDPIKREIILNIFRQDRELAKRFESAIMMEISDLKLKKLLKDTEQL